VAACVAVVVAAVVVPVVAESPCAPDRVGIFSQDAVPLGVSSVPGEKPPASDILFPPHPVTHLPEKL
jgi:hypothetical protein